MSKPSIVVSGASRGLGRALALGLSDKWDVTAFARGEAADADDPRAADVTHLSGIDVRDSAALDELRPLLAEADGLVNNVGVAYDGILATQSLESIQDVIDVNLVSVMYLTKLYVRSRLARRKGGSIVTVSSITSWRGFSGLAAYAASKAGTNAMTAALAREMGGKGFRFNSVLPGYFESELSAGLDEQKLGQITRRTPLGRLATPEDIVPAVDFLLSDDARFITGQLLGIDGGFTA
jgi:3-oxoacyl-[acyl-carrier protein] reductase